MIRNARDSGPRLFKHGPEMRTAYFQKGQVVLTATVFFLVAFLLIVTGVTIPIFADISASRENWRSGLSYALAEGLVEDVTYRLKEGLAVSTTENLSESGSSASAIITSPLPDQREVVTTGSVANAIRKIKVNLVVGTGASFNFGVQTGNGGFTLDNGSSVLGNVFSNGSVQQGSGNGAFVTGNVVSAGPTGLIDDIWVQGDAYAHSILNTGVDGAAYYGPGAGDFSGSTAPVQYAGSPDASPAPLPIDDSTVEQWKLDASTGGVLSCNGGTIHTIDPDTTLGPIKIPCDLIIEKTGTTVSLQGAVWVEGNLTFTNEVRMEIAPSIGSKSVPVVVEHSDRATKSKISINNNTTFVGSGIGNSYVLLLSQNNSSELGGVEPAITAKNNADGDVILYAGHGKVVIENNMMLKEVTAYEVHIQNNAQIIYESGLINLLFTSGPGGGFVIEQWVEEP